MSSICFLFVWGYGRRQMTRLAVIIGRDIGQRRFGDFHDFHFQAIAFCITFHIHGNRGIADLDDFGVDGQQVTDEYRMLE